MNKLVLNRHSHTHSLIVTISIRHGRAQYTAQLYVTCCRLDHLFAALLSFCSSYFLLTQAMAWKQEGPRIIINARSYAGSDHRHLWQRSLGSWALLTITVRRAQDPSDRGHRCLWSDYTWTYNPACLLCIFWTACLLSGSAYLSCPGGWPVRIYNYMSIQ